jgi:serine/threonine protein phosphatase PrpC
MVSTNNKEQLRRIRQMERHLARAASALKRLSSALDKYDEAKANIAALSRYYGSDDWKQDFADDEAGRLPKDLKRGVLSEDGIWNLLEDNKELQKKIRNIKKITR